MAQRASGSSGPPAAASAPSWIRAMLTETHTIYVKAFDRAGNETESEPVIIRVRHKPKTAQEDVPLAVARRSADARAGVRPRPVARVRPDRDRRVESDVRMPHILITNDDGYQAPALLALARSLRAGGPGHRLRARSQLVGGGAHQDDAQAAAHHRSALPDGTPLYVTTGTPSDCVGLALLGVVNRAARPGRLRHQPGLEPGPRCHLFGHACRRDGRQPSSAFRPSPPRTSCRTAAPRISTPQPVSSPGSPNACWKTDCRRTPCSTSTSRPCRRTQVRGIQVTRLGQRIYRDVLIQRADPQRPALLLDRRRSAHRRAGRRHRHRRTGAGIRLGHTAEPGHDRRSLAG